MARKLQGGCCAHAADNAAVGSAHCVVQARQEQARWCSVSPRSCVQGECNATGRTNHLPHHVASRCVRGAACSTLRLCLCAGNLSLCCSLDA
jgi:hypothetical protein